MITPRRICYCTKIQVSLFFSEYQRGPAAEECLNQQKGAQTHLDILKAESSATDAPRRDVHLVDNCCSLAFSNAPSCSSIPPPRPPPPFPPGLARDASSAIPRGACSRSVSEIERHREAITRLNSYQAESARVPKWRDARDPLLSPPPEKLGYRVGLHIRGKRVMIHTIDAHA